MCVCARVIYFDSAHIGNKNDGKGLESPFQGGKETRCYFPDGERADELVKLGELMLLSEPQAICTN